MLTESSIYSALTEIFSDVLDNDNIVLTRDTTAKDIDGWDSLTNIQIMLRTGQVFKLHFSAGQIQSFHNVGDLVAFIVDKSKS